MLDGFVNGSYDWFARTDAARPFRATSATDDPQ